jgi:adenine deaminase
MELELFIKKLPKAELHLHIEGSLEPELMFSLAKKNNLSLPYKNIAEVKEAYNFHNLQSFLDIYYAGASVLIEEDDFYQMTIEYLKMAHADGVVHTEIFFDPQTHTSRGIPFATFMQGFCRALKEAKEQWQMTSQLIMCFLRHLSEEDAFKTLEAAKPFLSLIKGVGLDSSEMGHPPSKFSRVFAKCRELGLEVVAHAGEEGPPSYVWEALHDLKVSRIDHGVRSEEDAELMNYLADRKIPLTVCPLSNIKLCVFKEMKEHNIKRLMEKGLLVTINSDDPAYFGGYVGKNYSEVAKHLNLSKADLKILASNSIQASYLSKELKQKHLSAIEALS